MSDPFEKLGVVKATKVVLEFDGGEVVNTCRANYTRRHVRHKVAENGGALEVVKCITNVS